MKIKLQYVYTTKFFDVHSQYFFMNVMNFHFPWYILAIVYECSREGGGEGEKIIIMVC